jgi:hypothetical protein
MVFGFDLPASLEQAANVIGGIGRRQTRNPV